jgi:type I restriction enzyme S subunit
MAYSKHILMNNNTIYKDSPLGKIPSDWEMKKLGELGQFSKGKGILKDQLSENGLPCIRYGEIYTTYDFIVKNVKSFISEEVSKESQEIKKGDILFAGSGETTEEIGKAVAYINDVKAYAGGDVIILSTHSSVNAEWLSFVLETNVARKQKRVLGQGNSIVHIYSSELSKVRLPFPLLSEQTRIAEVLSAWDKAISNIQATIEQVEQRNKWLLQELLTGKRRLKGFSGEWKRIHIHEVAKEVSIRNKENKQLTVLSCTKYAGLVDSLEYWGRQIFSEDISTYKIVPKNHFAYATNHIEEGSIGYQNVCNEALISPMYTVFKTDKSVNDEYFFKLLKSHRLIYEYNARMEGSIDRRGGLRWDAFSILKINLPSLEEQTAIAQVLQAAANEVQVLSSKLDKLKEQKKGLMQVLLTGKKRLNVNLQD